MAALPAWSWLVVGVIITGTAWYVEMPLFFWIGVLFIVVGIAKIIISASKKNAHGPSTHHLAHHTAAHPAHLERHQARYGHHAHQYGRCWCGNPVRATDTYCSGCGRRLR